MRNEIVVAILCIFWGLFIGWILGKAHILYFCRKYHYFKDGKKVGEGSTSNQSS